MNKVTEVERGDPVRLRFIEAMERRAAGHFGEARRLLDERVAALRVAYDAMPGSEPSIGVIASQTGTPSEMQRGPLSELAACIAEQAVLRGGGSDISSGYAPAGNRSAPTELASLAFFRSTWSRLSAERRLTKSLATVPENAGPLNSHQLVHRALQSMRETSPGYLHHFMTYVDALLWLDQAGGNSAVASVGPARAKPVKGGKAAVRGKSG
ncbi:DUF2894 domain-containing protein [Variovorax sp. RHLX14]|uniref:DUF2894 domain-containing protein n=1 Tax=Variovorax sp. RHLX14 TaxID=1259731 RepID=UPI003F45B11E